MRNKILIASSHRRPHRRHHHHLHLEATRVNANHLVSFAWRPVSCWLRTSSHLVHLRLHPPPQLWKRISIWFCFIFTKKIYNIAWRESIFTIFPVIWLPRISRENYSTLLPNLFLQFSFRQFFADLTTFHLTENIRIYWTQQSRFNFD